MKNPILSEAGARGGRAGRGQAKNRSVQIRRWWKSRSARQRSTIMHKRAVKREARRRLELSSQV